MKPFKDDMDLSSKTHMASVIENEFSIVTAFVKINCPRKSHETYDIESLPLGVNAFSLCVLLEHV